ncbi:MAG: PhoU domain-containing protein [Vicinamibacterales bacterium]|nr:PhoU domain-containing protein [Vicinamibacterales bacterium]
MPFKFLRGDGEDRLDEIEAKVQAMFGHDRHEFDLAMSALLGDVAAAEVNAELRAHDQKVNQLEREIRRALVVHASVAGGLDTPAVLVYMSVVKDIERIGDYAKNLLDLARDGARFSGAPDEVEWRRLTSDISRSIADVGAVFKSRDTERARQLLAPSGQWLALFDERVSALVRGGDAPQPVARALAYRYLKRVVAHLMNVLSAVVMPVDKLDYFDEDPEDR